METITEILSSNNAIWYVLLMVFLILCIIAMTILLGYEVWQYKDEQADHKASMQEQQDIINLTDN